MNLFSARACVFVGRIADEDDLFDANDDVEVDASYAGYPDATYLNITELAADVLQNATDCALYEFLFMMYPQSNPE